MHYKRYKTILSPKNGMNIYRGCSHGCIYCDARSTCYQMHHAFEDIEIKEGAPQMLEAELIKKRKKCMVGTGAMCDPYIHLEESLGYTRACLAAIDRHGFGLAIQTKSSRILRDLDLLKSIHQKTKCVVQITLTTHDELLCKKIEPHVSTTRERVDTLKVMQANGIPTVVWLSPILPFINDTRDNLLGLLEECANAGVKGILYFGAGVTLRDGDREYFYSALDRIFPGIKQKYVQHYGNAYECLSPNNPTLSRLFYSYCAEHGILCDNGRIFAYLNEFPQEQPPQQFTLF